MAEIVHGAKIAGVSKNNADGSSRQKFIKKYCKEDTVLALIREPKNPYDPNAIGVWVETEVEDKFVQIGYLEREDAAMVAPIVDKGFPARAQNLFLVGGTREKPTRGIRADIVTSASRAVIKDIEREKKPFGSIKTDQNKANEDNSLLKKLANIFKR